MGRLVAGYQAIAAIGDTIIKVIHDAKDVSGDPFIVGASVELFRRPLPQARPLLALHLYRIAHAARARQPDRTVGQGVARPVHTVDLHYLITAWANHPKEAHVLLGWALQALALTPQLPAALLGREFAGVFFDDETVELVPDTVSLQDLTNIWEVSKPEIPPSAAYVARGITLHATQPVGAGPVQARIFEHPGAPR